MKQVKKWTKEVQRLSEDFTQLNEISLVFTIKTTINIKV